MNNLLIVDDEREILEWLEELFLYEYEREIEVYTAASGHEAIRLLESIPFDVVLTDIKMPGMDGHKLFYRIKENWPRCRVVFLTGYRNFEDIYRIIQHSDVRYVLKSEDDDKISKAVDDSFREIETMLQQEWITRIGPDDLERTKAWLKREKFQDILDEAGRNPNFSDLKEFGIALDVSRRSLLYLVRFREKGQGDAGRLEELARAYLPGRITVYCHSVERGYFLLFFQPVSEQPGCFENIFTVTRGALEYIQANYEQCFGEPFCAVISSEPLLIAAVPGRAEQLKQLMVGYLGGKGDAILHAEAIGESEEELTAFVSKERPEDAQTLKYYLELRQKEEYYALLGALCRRMTAGRSHHDLFAMEIYYSIAVVLLQFINENHIQEKLAFEIGLYKLLNSGEHDSWVEAAAYLTELSEAVFAVLGYVENTLTDRALDRIAAYIDRNIAGDLSLAKLAQVGGFNASYLSRLFKQIHKVTVTDYVLKKRMELAKHYLSSGDLRIQEVAERTGYISSNSFSRAFRSCIGVSPVEYREVHCHLPH